MPHRAAAAVVLLLLAAPVPVGAQPANARSPLGINVRDVKYHGTELTSVDAFKRAGGGTGLWLTQSATTWDTNEAARLDLDPRGWPRSLPAATDGTVAYRWVTALLFWGTNRYPGGAYTVTWDGEGTLGYVGAATRNAALSGPGLDVVDVDPSRGGFGVSILATDPGRTGSYLRNIRVVSPGGTCDGDPTRYAAGPSACPATYRPFTQTYATEPFHPLFLADVKRYSTLRFVHFTGTNTTLVERWAQRVPPDVASWGGQRSDGAPYEAAFDLANVLDASPWLNVPARADDDYVRQLALLARSRLTTRRPVWVEYSNETWNGSYPYSIHALWMQQQGLARWPSSPLDPFAKQMSWFGLRTAQVCAIWKDVFADEPGRVQCVMGSQGANPGVSTAALDCPLHAAEPGGAPCHTGLDALAIGFYPGDHISQSRFQPLVAAWLAQPDGGVGSVFQELETGLLPRSGSPAVPMGALRQVQLNLASQLSIARARDLRLVAYEGGSGLDSANVAASDPLAGYYAGLQATFVTASRDPRIGGVLGAMLADWKQQGAELFNVFSSAQAWSQVAGNAAILEYEGQPPSEAPKYAATQAFIDAEPCWWGPPAPVPAGGGEVPEGGTISLSVPAVTGATYAWSGPGGFAAGARSVLIPGAFGAMSGVYSVRVMAGGCDAPAATVRVAVVPRAGTAPLITAPAEGAVVAVSGVTFAWEQVPGAARYELRLVDAGSGATLFSGSLEGAGSTSTLLTLASGSYTFAVRSCGPGAGETGCGPFASRPFRVALSTPVGIPAVTRPSPGAALTSSTQTLAWSGVRRTDPTLPLSYEVLLVDAAAGDVPELRITLPESELSTVYTMHGSRYELKVRACQAACGPWSAPVSFTVALGPVPVAVPALSSCSVSSGSSLSCDWGAVSGADLYELMAVQPSSGPGGGALSVAARRLSATSVTLPVPPGPASVIVRACNGDGCGGWSDPFPVAPAGPGPSAPALGTPMAGTVVQGPVVLFTWSRVPGDTGSNTRYRLFVQDLSRQATALDVYTTDNYHAAVFRAEGSRYDALVVANPGLPGEVVGPAQGFGVSGASATAPTLVAPPHGGVVRAGNAQLGWSPVPGATLYEYFVAVAGQPEPVVRGVTPGLLVQVPLAAPGAATLHSGIVRACPAGATCTAGGDSGWGPWSNAPGGPGVTTFTLVP